MQLQGADKVFNLPASRGIHPWASTLSESESEERPWGGEGCWDPKGTVLRRDYLHRERRGLEGGQIGKKMGNRSSNCYH